MRRSPHTVDYKHHIASGRGLQLPTQQADHLGCRIVSRNQRFLASTALAVLAHADLHDTFRKVGNDGSVLRVRARLHRHGERRHILVVAFGYLDQFLGRRTEDLVQRDASRKAAAVVVVGSDTGTYVVMRQHLGDLYTGTFGQLACHVGAHDVARMVEYHEQDTGLTLHQLQGLEQALGPGGGEYVAHDRAIEHALAYETAQGGLVAGAAQSDDSDLVLRFGIDPHHDILIGQLHLIGVRQHIAFQQFGRDIFGIVYEFRLHIIIFLILHLHDGDKGHFTSISSIDTPSSSMKAMVRCSSHTAGPNITLHPLSASSSEGTV